MPGTLHVLVIITRGEPGGAQVHVLELVRGLRGVVRFDVAIGDDAFLAGEVRALDVPVHVVPELQRAVSPATDLRGFRALRALIEGLRPDLVHTHSSKAGVLGRLAARAVGVPAIHTAHAWSFSDGIPWRQKGMAIPVEALAGRVTRRFIVVSDADREVATRWRVAREAQIRIVHNGLSDISLRASPEAADVPILTMVARMAPPKDHHLLLRAIAGMNAACRLRFVGDGPDRPGLEARAHELGLDVAFLGVRNDVPALLAESQAGLLVSRQEGFPLAVLEAMRAGLPVIASDVGGIREAVTHGVTGYLVRRGDEDGLREAIERVVTDPALRRAMGAAGRRAYEARFTVDGMLSRTRQVYAEVAG